MRREPIRAHARNIDQPAFNHVPAERALQTAEHEHDDQFGCQRAFDATADEKVKKRHQKDHANQPAEQTVRPLDIEYALELVQRHPGIYLLVLRSLLVFIEGLLPLGLAERRNGAHDRVPFDNRKSGAGQPCHTPQYHHRKY